MRSTECACGRRGGGERYIPGLLASLFAEDSSVNVGYDYDRVRKESNGKEYVLPKDLKLSIDAKGMTIHLENLFNGDKFLGKWGHTHFLRV